MTQSIQEIIILGGISCLSILWIAAVVGMMQIGWNSITAPPHAPQKKGKPSYFPAQTAFKKMFPKDSLRAESRLKRVEQLRKMRPKK